MKVVIIGLGSIGRKHSNVLLELIPSIEIFALRSNKNADIVNNIINIFSYSDIPIDIDFFLISSPTYAHLDVLKEIVHFNKPIFIEKPAFHKINEEVMDVINEIEKREIFTYVGYSLRYHPCIQFLNNKIQSLKSSINEVNIYCGSNLKEWRNNQNYRECYSVDRNMGGGVHLDLSHEIDYTCFIFGLPKYYSAFFNDVSSLKINAIDFAQYILEYETYTVNITLNYYRPKPKREIEIVFENDIWKVDMIDSLITNKDNQTIFCEKTNQLINLKNQMIDFLNSLKTNYQIGNSLKESLNTLKICLNYEFEK